MIMLGEIIDFRGKSDTRWVDGKNNNTSWIEGKNINI